MDSIIYLVAGVILGAIASWYVTRYYYLRASIEAKNAAMARRLDDCTEWDKTFLVALLNSDSPIPRYAFINVEYETLDGQKKVWGSDTSSLIRSISLCAKHSFQIHLGNNVDEDRHKISLTDRGRENAEYLIRYEYRSSRFSKIEDDDSTRLRIFRNEHGRDPFTKNHKIFTITKNFKNY